MANAGGTADIESRPGHGGAVTVSWPAGAAGRLEEGA